MLDHFKHNRCICDFSLWNPFRRRDLRRALALATALLQLLYISNVNFATSSLGFLVGVVLLFLGVRKANGNNRVHSKHKADGLFPGHWTYWHRSGSDGEEAEHPREAAVFVRAADTTGEMWRVLFVCLQDSVLYQKRAGTWHMPALKQRMEGSFMSTCFLSLKKSYLVASPSKSLRIVQLAIVNDSWQLMVLKAFWINSNHDCARLWVFASIPTCPNMHKPSLASIVLLAPLRSQSSANVLSTHCPRIQLSH